MRNNYKHLFKNNRFNSKKHGDNYSQKVILTIKMLKKITYPTQLLVILLFTSRFKSAKMLKTGMLFK